MNEKNWYIRCVKCGTQNPIDAKRCRNYSCRADLMIYGVVIVPDAPGDPAEPPEESDPPIGPKPKEGPISGPEPEYESETEPEPENEPATEPEPENEPMTGPEPENEPMTGQEPEDEPVSGPGSEEEPVIDPGKKKRNRKILLIVIIAALAAALAAAAFGIYTVTTRSRVLMEYPKSNDYVFGKTTIHRDQIVSITFTDSLADAPDSAWDVSEYSNGSVKAWVVSTGETNEDGDELYDLYIGANGIVKAPADCKNLFLNYENVREIRFNGCFDTSAVTSMLGMFANCSSLTEVDLSGFETAQVDNMAFMFLRCSSLTDLDLSGFDTSAVYLMRYMFYGCEALTELKLSGFDTSAVTYMDYMFYGCEALTGLDLSGFDTSAAKHMNYMLYGISDGLEASVSADDFSNFDTSNTVQVINFMDGTDIYDWTALFDNWIMDSGDSYYMSPEKYLY